MISVPVFLSNSTEIVSVEIQFRTIAMDFWASLEHELRYKTETNVDASIKSELKECAEQIASIDQQMQKMRIKILEDNKNIEEYGENKL